MDTQKIEKAGFSKALIALTAAASCLVIYILACVISPVTWSPDSSKIAMLVTPADDEPAVYSLFTYDIATGKRLLLDKVGKYGALSAPAWSPDGKWIAYYKVDPSPQTEPKATTEKVTGEELFSEKNKMLPSFLLHIAKEQWEKEMKDRETFDVKLMVVRPNGEEKKVLRVLKFVGDDDAHKALPSLQPAWSANSKSLFYIRAFNDEGYVAGLDMDTGQTYIHLFTSVPVPAVSPDGNWLASWFEDTLILSRLDGTISKYIKIDDSEKSTFAAWSPDSKSLLLTAKDKFLLIDTISGDKQIIRDTDARLVAYGHFSPDGDMIYYVAGYKNEASNSSEDKYSIRSMNLHDESKTVLFKIPEEISVNLDSDMMTPLSVSPNGRMFLIRAFKEEENKSILLFLDGKKEKIVETDPWLVNILFADKDLVFEEKLIGKWKSKDGETIISERAQKNAYKFTVIRQNGEEKICAANLYKQNNIMFLCVRSDEDDEIVYVKVDQIEPKLLLRKEMDYDEMAEMLSKPPESLKQDTTAVDYAFEGTRVQ
jgi:Tol biopolymer transport system component